MGDPFSVAGSAVGVISLGLSICQGLLAYYGPFKAYDEQIHDVSNRITSFDSTLKALEDVLAHAQVFSSPLTAQSATVALDSIFACQEGLERLSKMLERCKGTASAKSFLGSKIQINRILYPFRRDTLMAILETVSWLQAHLNTSLQILNMAMMVITQKQTDMIITYSASSALQTSQILQVAKKSDQRGISIENRLGMLEDNLKQMQLANSRNKARPAFTPGLLQSVIGHQLILDEESDDKGTIIISSRNRRRKRCSCSNSSGTTSAWKAHASRSAHTSECELHKESKTVITFLHRQITCRWAVRISLEASFSSARGAGGFSISPRLEFHAIVPSSSQIFLALSDAEKCLESQDVSSVIKDAQKAIFEAFREGKASKSDALPDGNTILHVVTGWQYHSCWWDTRSQLTWRSFIDSLLQAGLSPDRTNDRGQTPADRIIEMFAYEDRDLDSQQITINICSDLLKAGGYMTQEALDWRHQEKPFDWVRDSVTSGSVTRDGRPLGWFLEFSFRLIWRLADEKGLQDIDLPEELQPLAYKSKKLLATQLRKGTDFNRWINSYACWATGLAMILQSGHASAEGVLISACQLNCEESVKMLIEDQRCFIGMKEFEISNFHPNPTIVDLIVNGFIDRRKRLQTLAEAHLPSSVTDQLNIRSHILLNVHAYEVYTLLETTSANLEGLLERQRWSVFDYIGVNLDLADRLWNAGFRDVDEIEDDNMTCLTKLWGTTPICSLEVFLQKAHWLISKGADVHHQKSFESALYALGNSVGKFLYDISNRKDRYALEIQSLSEASKNLLITILFDDTRDDCDCACSMNGCSPLTGLLGGLFPTLTYRESADPIQVLVSLLRVAPFSSNYRPDTRVKSRLSAEILRFITFRSLEITHTCMHEYRTIEPEEIKEIQDEEKLLILDLERLLTRFLEELKGYGGQLPDFITTLWRTQMTSFLSTPRSYSAK